MLARTFRPTASYTAGMSRPTAARTSTTRGGWQLGPTSTGMGTTACRIRAGWMTATKSTHRVLQMVANCSQSKRRPYGGPWSGGISLGSRAPSPMLQATGRSASTTNDTQSSCSTATDASGLTSPYRRRYVASLSNRRPTVRAPQCPAPWRSASRPTKRLRGRGRGRTCRSRILRRRRSELRRVRAKLQDTLHAYHSG
jgi:hypothetical protein